MKRIWNFMLDGLCSSLIMFNNSSFQIRCHTNVGGPIFQTFKNVNKIHFTSRLVILNRTPLSASLPAGHPTG